MRRLIIGSALALATLVSVAPPTQAQDIRCAPVPFVVGQPPDPGPVPLYPPLYPTPPQVLYGWASLVQWSQFYQSARAWTTWQQANCAVQGAQPAVVTRPGAVETPVPVYTGD